MQVTATSTNDSHERRAGAAVGRGFEGDATSPSASPLSVPPGSELRFPERVPAPLFPAAVG